MSKVEDFDIHAYASEDDGSEEFGTDKNKVDDKTMLFAEERQGREMGAKEEITMLQHED